MQDPRTLDKNFVVEASRKVVSFLNEHGYDKEITVKSLQSPAVKTYAGIIEFLFQFIDPNFCFKGESLENEIPVFFKSIEYPVAISKASLKVISPNEWPKLLGALVWLVELLCIDTQLAREKEELALLDQGDGEAVFFEYLRDAYAVFMAGQDATPELDAQLALQFDAKNAQVEQDIAQDERTVATLQKDIVRLEEQVARLPALKKQRAALQDDVAKFAKFNAELDEYVHDVQRKLAANEKDVSAKRKRLEQLLAELATLQKRMDAQVATGIDFRAKVAERAELEEHLAQLRSKRDMTAKVMGENQIQLGKSVELVEREVAAYTKLAMRLGLVPHASNTLAPGVNFDLQFKSHAVAEQMIGVDLATVVRPALKSLRATLTASAHALSDQSAALRKQLDLLMEQLEQQTDQVEELSGKLHAQERQCAAAKEALDMEQAQLRMTAKALRDDTEAQAKQMAERLHESQKAVESLRAEEKRLKAQLAHSKMTLNGAMLQVVDHLTTYKRHVQDQLRELVTAAYQVNEELKH